jgi:hypothetical protein
MVSLKIIKRRRRKFQPFSTVVPPRQISTLHSGAFNPSQAHPDLLIYPEQKL